MNLHDTWMDLLIGWNTRENGHDYLPGRNDYPAALMDIWGDGELDEPELLAVAVEEAWTMAEYPARYLDPSEWWEPFWDARQHLHIPSAPITVYRGVKSPEHAYGMSWSGTKATAEWFANRFGSSGGHVYTIVAKPDQILAHFHAADGRQEDEYVLDLEKLDNAAGAIA